MTIPVPDTLRAPCIGPATDGLEAMQVRLADTNKPVPVRLEELKEALRTLANFSLLQEQALVTCDAKRAGLVGQIDQANGQAAKRDWWPPW